MIEAGMTTDRNQFHSAGSTQPRLDDPFYNLDRILNGENPKPSPQTRPVTDPYLALRPTMSSEPKKPEVNWGDLESEISNFTAAQKRHTDDQSYIEEAPYVQPLPEAPPRKATSGMKTIGAIVGIALIGTTAVLGYRGLTGGTSSSEPKVIKATTTPEKVVVPQAPKETANKSVLERAPAVAAVVPRDEKPLNSAQQAEQTTGAKVMTTDPDEPRKVRTVTISSDGNGNAVTRPTIAAVGIPAALPPVTNTGSIDTSNLPARSVKTQTIAATQPKPVEVPKATPPKPAAPAAPVAAPTSVMTPKVQAPPAPKPAQVAGTNAPMQLGSNASAAKPVASTATPVASPSGSYSVQVGSAKTEAEAKAAFKSMQGKYSTLEGRSANFIKADVNGNSLYRIRLSPTTKEAAESLCTKLKASGGACFLSKS